ncbi:hypothetical protein B7760_03954 [Burkholderia glumae]|uniref:hypothetical protein n=1 Tax=Burkholderia glumae TaxID=337 RepID=UPI00137457F3|nr:hypothetical protein [Burkholderia glumae]MCR1771083.1 hypothetical protein [Burkholderia glumae]QHP94389.1 hypothetical protein EXE55_26780 [Burkholderia glumae]QKM49894.1 hypothetical protein B7760_03954 [Burkholderia glumae]
MTDPNFPHHHGAEWKSVQIAHIGNLSRLHAIAMAAVDRKRDEIAALRRAVFESIRVSGRKLPQMTDVITYLEAIFSLTAPCHLDAARQAAALMQSALEQASSSLRDFPDRDIENEVSIRTLDEAMAHLFQSCEQNARRMTVLLANAEREIFSLQEMLVKFAP